MFAFSLCAALLPAQAPPRATPEASRALDARYDLAYPWWNPNRGTPLPASKNFADASGELRLVNKSGAIETKGHAFFTALGSNGRACVTCHQPTSAMGLSLDLIRNRWADTGGKDPLFTAVDGSNCPELPQSDPESHSLLLERGLFRIALPWPPASGSSNATKPEFRIEVVRDPTGCNKNPKVISVYRRPRVAANLSIVLDNTGVLMADGRESNLRSQAHNALRSHEEPPVRTDASFSSELKQIEDFELQLFMAQQSDVLGGLLAEPGGPPLLGADNLASGVAGTGAAPVTGSLIASFDPWRKPADLAVRQRAFRESVLRGVDLFASRRFPLADGTQATCATCHRARSTLSPADRTSMAVFADIGTTNLPSADLLAKKESQELPVFRITCDTSAPAHPQLGRSFLTHDPGRALITGKCADVGSILMQQFRGLAARAPYFANGSATDLGELVDFYDRRFKIGFTDKDKQDLVNFLSIL